MNVFVDTGPIVALALRQDQHHGRAVKTWRLLQDQGANLVTTDWVFGEIVSFLRRRAGYAAARDVGESLRESSVLHIVSATADWVDRAWEAFLRHRFPRLSLVDCLSFVCMRQQRLHKVFTFDTHFRQAGFEVL